MSVTFAFAFFLLGATAASFIGVLVGRVYTGISFLYGRSVCDSCGHALSGIDLVPVLSYLAMRGRARCCGSRISPESTMVELALGALYVLAYLKIGLEFSLFFLFIALAALLALVLYDLRHTILPVPFLAMFILAALGYAFFSYPSLAALGTVTLVAGGIGLSLAAIHFVSGGRAMGLADAPLAFGLALLAGSGALSGFIFSFWIGALIGITILVRTPKGARMGIEVPFAPFLAAGFLLAFFTQWNPLTLTTILIERLLGS